MAHFITSTMSSDVNYVLYKKANGSFVADRTILVKGKANVADKRLITKDGVVTKVTKEELDLLKEHPIFKAHEKNGFITISNLTESKAENKVKDMSKKDASAQLTPKDYAEKGKEAPKTESDTPAE